MYNMMRATSNIASYTLLLFFFSLASCRVDGTGNIADVAACDSQIYCDGPILHHAQMLRIYNDSKTFVDKSLKQDPDVVTEAFEKFLLANPDPTKQQMIDFVDTYFGDVATEFEKWDPESDGDWHPNIGLLNRIEDAKLRQYARDLHAVWKLLGRRISLDVKSNPQLYSLIYSPSPFIVPGGRFREIYYWDSYWTIKGLILSEMTDTVKGMINNFVTFIKELGFVPNGGRIYYTRRSQPPLLIPIVNDYYVHTADLDFVKGILEQLETEYKFWMKGKRRVTVNRNGAEYILNRYDVEVGKPRPESYREDYELAADMEPAKAADFCSNIASACESGWDFSSRWIQGDGTKLRDIKTTTIVPTDLNAILCWNEKLLAKFYGLAGNEAKQREYEALVEQRRAAIRAVLWSDDDGAWFDWNMEHSSPNNDPDNHYVSSVMPYYVGCHHDDSVEKPLWAYLKKSTLLDHIGGVPTSTLDSDEQWDYPNVWPPLEEIMVTSLSKMSIEEAKSKAVDLAQLWIFNTWLIHNSTGKMYEKFNCEESGEPGGGGEYDVQDGFGWTNGVVLQLLDKYGDVLVAPSAATSLSRGATLCQIIAVLVSCLLFRLADERRL
ncbi:PREDICTED: trehalase-like [Priapulus caudatus]|uniref:Trehalase n=1 Tax=Priapulus caudatus TaxID=37621 RepID=A0ABM1DVU5_PRICU|nr:PREDICTED: trehalase-like [Priapulus caudatus]